MAKEYQFNGMPVIKIERTISNHKVKVNGADTDADYVLNKQTSSSDIGFANDTLNPGKMLVLLDKSRPEATSNASTLLRSISAFSIQQIDSEYTNMAGSQHLAKIIVYPITISIGEIKGFSLVTKDDESFEGLDRVQIAIASNSTNNIAGAKIEFFGQYGYGDSNDNLTKSIDGKSFSIADSAQHKSIDDLTSNYHFVLIFLHIDSSLSSSSSLGVAAKSSSGSPLIEAGKNRNYCGMFVNRSTMLSSDIIDSASFEIVGTCSIETNLQVNFPYIEFYQVR